jgi:hypothetical protein
MNRRNLMAMAPAAALAAILPQAVPAKAESSILALLREWEDKRAQIERLTLTDDELDAMSDEMFTIEAQMLVLPSRDGRDFAAKMIAHTARGAFGLTGEGTKLLMAEADMVVGGVI